MLFVMQFENNLGDFTFCTVFIRTWKREAIEYRSEFDTLEFITYRYRYYTVF